MAEIESKDQKQIIVEAYIDFVLEHDKIPSSPYLLCKKIGMSEEDFYTHFSSVQQINKEIWGAFFTETKNRITAEEVYEDYSIREKVLAFYFTLIEVMKAQRSYAQLSYKQKKKLETKPHFLHIFHEGFREWVGDLILEGRESQEIAERISFITDQYPKAFWLQCLSIMEFWTRDFSDGFEKTDAFIEKSVNLSMDLINENLIDSVFDFGKFMFQK